MRKLLLSCLAVSSLLAQAPAPSVLTDQRVYDLVTMGVSTREIMRIIAAAPKIDFDLRPESTDTMLKAGVSEEILKAMAARESGSSVQTVPTSPVRYQPSPEVRVVEPPKAVVEAPRAVVEVQRAGTLYQGTPVRMRIMHTVSSADAQVGNNVDFQTLDDVKQGGMVIIPRGSEAIATITIAESKKRMARGGKLGMNIDYVRLPNGDQLPLRGVQNMNGGGHTGAMTGAMVATAIVFWPAAPFFLFMHGKDVVIPEGHEVTVYTNTDYKF